MKRLTKPLLKNVSTFFGELHILIDHMKNQFDKRSLFKRYLEAKSDPENSVLEIDNVEIDLGEEISNIMRKTADLQKIKKAGLELIEEELRSEIISSIAKGVIFNGVISASGRASIARFLTGKVTQAMFKKALISTGAEMVPEILISSGRASLLTALTFPLHGYRLSDEDIWIDLTEHAPVLLLNPAWKHGLKNGLRQSNDWQVHCRAITWKPDRIEWNFNHFLSLESKNFDSRMGAISSMEDFSNFRTYKRDHLPQDGTFIRPKILPKF